MSNDSAPVLYEVRRGIALITLNRPESRNAVNPAVAEELSSILDKVEQDPDVQVCVLTGAGGKAFCAGMDLKAFAAGQGKEIISETDGFAGFTSRQRSKPFIAAVNGAAMGGGCELVLACDMAVAAEHALLALPEVKRGLFAAAGGALRLPRMMPRVRAMEMLLSGDPLTASEAYDLGLLNRVVPLEGLLDAALGLAGRIAANAPLAVRTTLALARRASEPDLELWRENARAWARVAASEDAEEGPRAFREKRAPVWKGR